MSELTVFYNATLFDGIKQGFTANSWFSVQDGKIVAVGTGEPAESAHMVNCEGLYIMPGMINAHTHLVSDPDDPTILIRKNSIVTLTKKAIDNARELLESGIVLIRDLGCPMDIDLELRTMLNNGSLLGPDALVSGTPIVMSGGHGYLLGLESDGEDEVRKHTRQLLKKGVDVVKFMASGGVVTGGETPHDVQLSEAELRAGIMEAKHKGKKTAAHAQGRQSIINAIHAGIDTIEHGVYMDDEVIELFLKHEVTLVPTLVAPYYIVEAGKENKVPQYMVDKSQGMMDDHLKSFAKAVKAGVTIALGTDAGTPFNHYRNTAFELVLMTQAGMSNQQALFSATSVAAKTLGVEGKYGVIAPGAFADVIGLSANPLEDISACLSVERVYKRGVSVK